MMNMLKKRLNKKGFTLAELLIVVAIIAVLVAVSIPIFTKQLEKAREKTDIANIRACKGALSAEYLSGDADQMATDLAYIYDADKGELVMSTNDTAPTVTDIVGYGQGTTTDGGCADTTMGTVSSAGKYTKVSNAKGRYLAGLLKSDGTYTMEWTAKSGS